MDLALSEARTKPRCSGLPTSGDMTGHTATGDAWKKKRLAIMEESVMEETVGHLMLIKLSIKCLTHQVPSMPSPPARGAGPTPVPAEALAPHRPRRRTPCPPHSIVANGFSC